jgi:hypothetical protein
MTSVTSQLALTGQRLSKFISATGLCSRREAGNVFFIIYIIYNIIIIL